MMTNSAVEVYFQLMGDDESAKLALLACSTGLRMDDHIALEAIELVVGSNGETGELLRGVKTLGCVWQQWDGSWYIAEDVRQHLQRQLDEEVPRATRAELRKLLASHAEERAAALSHDGQVTAYWRREARLEAAIQRTLIPGQSETGAEQLAEVWQDSVDSAREATARCVDYLAPELERQLQRLPAEVLFLQGMAARDRGDKRGEERYFRAVWQQGRAGYIYAVAAHLFGLLVRDPVVAEQAMRDSIRWNADPYDQGIVWHSLGNLLAKQRHRWDDAEKAYAESLELLRDPADQGQTWHSLGNLLAKQRDRWDEAKEAYKKSLQVRHDAFHQGQVWHSLGNLLAKPPKDDKRWGKAEEAYAESLRLRDDAFHQGQVWHSLGNLLAKQRERWDEAEEAYAESLRLRDDAFYQGQVRASWADLLRKYDHTRAEEQALEGLKADPDSPKTRGICHRVLAGIYESQRRFREAAEEAEAQAECWRLQGNRGGETEWQRKAADLRKRAQDARPGHAL